MQTLPAYAETPYSCRAQHCLTKLTNCDAGCNDRTMAKVVNLSEAKSRFSSLVEEAASGTEVIIAKAGVPRSASGTDQGARSAPAGRL
jgi:hypothetical protein